MNMYETPDLPVTHLCIKLAIIERQIAQITALMADVVPQSKLHYELERALADTASMANEYREAIASLGGGTC